MSIRNLGRKSAEVILNVCGSLVLRWARERRFGEFDKELGRWRFSRAELEKYNRTRIGRGQRLG